MKKQNQLNNGRPIFEITMICVLVLIIIGAVVLLFPTVYKKQLSSENQSSARIRAEDCNVSESEVLVDDTDSTETSTEETTIFSESTIEIPTTSIELEACLFGLTEDEQARVYALMDGMTLREKIYQMMIVTPSQITGVTTVIAADSGMQSALAQHPVGGLFYNATNMQSQEQVATMLSNTQSYCEIPVLTMCDEEGGVVSRLMKTVGTTWVGSMLGYESQGTEIARQNAQTIALDMAKLGFNLDLAPVADVWSNPSNTVIAERAYSTDFNTAAMLIPSAVEGFHQGGVACTLKHFPGHGDTAEDSHYSTAIVNKSLDELRMNELLPFQAGIDAGADAVMMGHLTLPQIDEQPALFSYAIVTDLLRVEMGFQGVVMTDALEMAAIADYYSSATTAVKAVSAGVDMLLVPVNLTDSVNVLENAVNNGTITEERIDQSVARILALKIRRGILN
jgi:beta-N-acetylhexosaminidase